MAFAEAWQCMWEDEAGTYSRRPGQQAPCPSPDTQQADALGSCRAWLWHVGMDFLHANC